MNNKKFKSINNKNNKRVLKRDSFSGRICDDLCEVLLSYLSFADKIRFECVSKQFQRLIFNKQYIIEINQIGVTNKNTLNTLLIKEKNYSFNYKAFESVLKKCKFINNIIIKLSPFKELINTEEVFNLIIKNCNNLKSIEFNFNKISDELIEKFGKKLGQKLVEITFIKSRESEYNINKYAKLLRLCPNLVAFGERSFTHLSLFVDSNELLVPKLSSIGFDSQLDSQNIQLFETFAQNYKNSLKSVSISACIRDNDIDCNVLLKQIIHLKNLTKLKLFLGFDENSSEEFIDNLKTIAIQCNQLNSFKFDVLRTNPLVHKQIFNCLAFFQNLKVLYLNLYNHNQKSNEISCESLKDLKLLTHLKLLSPKMNDIFFVDIDKHLPQLKHLDIRVDNKITNKAMNSLSKLEKLQSIKIRCPEGIDERSDDILSRITDSGLIHIINNCPQINSIVFNCRPNISHKTIDALIALASRKPRIYFTHHFKYSDPESYKLPNNLVIKKLEV
jgi:hypothetical protein